MNFDEIALDFLKSAEWTKTNIFLTWVAWSGKSTLFNFFTSKTKKRFVPLWTTWVAAQNIWWYTIHSFFWIKPDLTLNHLKKERIDYIRKTDIFVIDEVSMCRADLFDTIDFVLRKYTWIDEAFWWKQLILIWDLLQLPPVLVKFKTDQNWQKIETEEYNNFMKEYNWLKFFYNAKSYDKDKFKTINLQKVYRQNNQELINNLNLIRVWIQSSKILNYFNQKITSKKNLDPKAVMLASTNRIVDKINQEKLEEIKSEEFFISATVKWDYDIDNYPAERYLKLKKWARVMFTKNDMNLAYCNWTLWTILEAKPQDWILNIELDNWTIIVLWRFTWKNIIWEDEFWEEIVAWTFTQYPIKLAFAISIHKSQWKTFDHVIIDTWYWCFESGMLYVALSRVTSIDWLQLVKPLKINEIQADINVKTFLDN